MNCDQTGKPQQLLYTAFNLGVSSLGYRDSCYEHNVIASADLRKPQPHNLAHAPADAISNNSPAYPAADREAKAADRQSIGKQTNNQKSI